MKYKILTSRGLYYLDLTMRAVALLLLSFIFQEIVLKGVVIIAYVTLGFMGILAVQFVHFLSKNIYAKIDLSDNKFVYGNVFFNEETQLGDVKYIGRTGLRKQSHKIKVGERVFWIFTAGEDISKFL